MLEIINTRTNLSKTIRVRDYTLLEINQIILFYNKLPDYKTILKGKGVERWKKER